MDPKIDAKRKNKSLKLEVEEKKAKMLQNGCQRDPEGYPNSKKNRYENIPKKVFFFFHKKRGRFRVRTQKVVILHHTSVNS